MVLLLTGGSQTVNKRRRMTNVSRWTEALTTPVQGRQTDRHRKQKLMSRLSDSGFEEDFGSSHISPRISASPLRIDDLEGTAGQLSNWYLQYGDIGFKIQRDKEAKFHPCKSLARQPQVTAEDRCKLVSWLIPVHKHFRLSFECCCLAVNIMDRFLASTPVAADCFQLLGVTALLLASKKVEVCSPRISHLLSLCCDAFTKEQLCNLECLILLRLNFCLGAPTLAFFLDYYTKCIEAAQLESGSSDKRKPRQCSNFARKVCELSLADYAFNKYLPSLTASCALRLSCELLKTEQGLMEATVPSGDDQRDTFCESNHSLTDRAFATEKPGLLEGCSLSVSQGSCDNNLVQECKNNLKLLVSLNQETLEVLSNM
ncbi:cyclin-O [Aulostomus maculatus]